MAGQDAWFNDDYSKLTPQNAMKGRQAVIDARNQKQQTSQGMGGVTVGTPSQVQNQNRMLAKYGRDKVIQGQAQEQEQANQEFMKPTADTLAYQDEMAKAKKAYQAKQQPVVNLSLQRAGAPPPLQPQEPKSIWGQMYDRAASYFN